MVVSFAFVFSCARGPVTLATWKDPGYASVSIGRVLIVGVAKKEIHRRIFEDEFVRALGKYNVTAQASYPVFSHENLEDDKAVAVRVKGLGADAVLVARKIDCRREEIVHPGEVVVVPDYRYGRLYPYPYYYDGWYSFYRQSYQVIEYPGYTEQVEIITLETNLYDAKTDKLIWASTTEIQVSDQDRIEGLVKDFIASVVNNLVQEKIIGFR